MRKFLFFVGVVAVTAFIFLLHANNFPAFAKLSCELYQAGSSIPAGFGLPWETAYLPSQLALTASCDGSSVDVVVGNGSAIASQTQQYVYTAGYHWQNNQWNKMNYQCDTLVVSGAWCPGKVSATIQNPQDSYYVAYMCTWISYGGAPGNSNGGPSGQWHCGCQDNTCATPAWQLQGWRQVTMTSTPTPTPNATGMVQGLVVYDTGCSANCLPVYRLPTGVRIVAYNQNQSIAASVDLSNTIDYRVTPYQLTLPVGIYTIDAVDARTTGSNTSYTFTGVPRYQVTVQDGQTVQVDIRFK